ncbi:MAG: DNA-directed RNA polymerase subunit H [Candidatus Marsarchaeota archaeon]|nr:DNA-directed RNA polymerase subunit H [Candidatus Marsarchaeota archaeon]
MVFGEDLLVEHELLSGSDALKIAKKFGAPLEKFPKIFSDDPQVLKLNAKPGDLVLVHRQDPTGSYDYYRYVVER